MSDVAGGTSDWDVRVANERMYYAQGQPGVPAYDTAYMEVDTRALIDEPRPAAYS